MPAHTLIRDQFVPSTLAQAWSFFSDPRNLSLITPPQLGLQVVSPNLPARIYKGLEIEYCVKALPRFSMKWLTEITHVVDHRCFIDEQRVGPYALWRHEHYFAELKEGGVQMSDRVTYRLPFQPFGELAHAAFVKPRLKFIFDYREERVRKLFSKDLPN
ncbi:ligand-binding SRPBCC domain-containing protein [Roseimicrobium gellanilyticum]|uniref:Ligand-binding SRPBCC domain-containing protein n=1 Tax=Roseimicrobium gellanilyticum TaxID=748857 RepID=A0A366H1A6_9BACT|nr:MULTISPECIES: SRPBCC family protein [Roseimicrobium]QIF02888.1 SRPBCC family protein [Roseimicrobium sp. ORNL1]RBP35654.1 ligand-binding SRPBCC domain-containing protein [Roseimicrobium gellanilyticum]